MIVARRPGITFGATILTKNTRETLLLAHVLRPQNRGISSRCVCLFWRYCGASTGFSFVI